MHEQKPTFWRKCEQRLVSRRNLIRGAAGTVVGAGLLSTKAAIADDDDHVEHTACALANPIPGGLAPFAPFGVFIHHNPLNPAVPLAMINDPSQITDFDGFVGLTHIRGGGTGTNTVTHAVTPLAFQADMGFSKGKFKGADGQIHQGTFAFV
jgi:hypothetical protein